LAPRLTSSDNEGGWSLRSGSINVLFSGGAVRTYGYRGLQEQFGLGDFDRDVSIVTFGPTSPIVPCRKLDN